MKEQEKKKTRTGLFEYFPKNRISQIPMPHIALLILNLSQKYVLWFFKIRLLVLINYNFVFSKVYNLKKNLARFPIFTSK
jgi:hypothetical protein